MTYDPAESIARNTGVMLISQGVTWISSLVLMLCLPRYLGSEEYGRFYLAFSIALIFQMVIEFGGPYLIAKEVSRSREKAPSLLVNSLAIRILMWAFSMIAMIALAMVAGYSATVTTLIIIFGISKLWEGSGRVLASCFQGFEMMQYPAIGAITERVAVAVFGVVALLLGAHSVVIAVIWAASTLLNFGILAGFTRRIVSSIPRVEWSDVRELTKAGLPYFLWSVFAVLYYRVDAVMLSFLTPDAVVGWYGAAYRLFDVLMFLPSIFSSALFPVLSRLWGRDADSLAGTTRKSLDFILLAGIPISVLVYAGAEQIIGLLFGLKEYAPSVLLLKIFSAGLLLVYIDFILISTLVASDRQRQWVIAAFVAMLVNPALNYVLIPLTQSHFGNGGIGSAIATLLTEFLVMCMALALMPRTIFEHPRIDRSLKGIVAGIFMIASIYGMNLLGFSAIPGAIAGLGIYCCILLSLKVVRREDLQLIQHLIVARKVIAVEKGINT